MAATLIDGRAIAGKIKDEIKADVDALVPRVGRPPGLATVLVGDDPASASYVRGKRKTCAALGVRSIEHALEAGTDRTVLLDLVRSLNDDDTVDGILVQSPLPPHLDENEVVGLIDPAKDVDGFHPVSIGKLLLGQETFVSCTPAGVRELLVRSGVETRGAHAVIVGRSSIVGKPLAALLMQKADGADATVTVCHSRTRDLPEITCTADILVAAIGRARFVTADMVRPGAVVIDVGINRVEDPSAKRGYRLVGDVDFDAVVEVASQITPVPGGVGPMTVAMLMRNTLLSYRRRCGV
jgi:methylenetetrahydrofolate dehydrogenase (NADP+)/methenyltetrahydrofolate cyclohydrolase